MHFRYWKTGHPVRPWHFHMKSENHKIVAYGQAYKSERGCLKGIALVNGNNNYPVKWIPAP